MVCSLWSHRELTWQLAKRDLEMRYREARLGLLWAVLTPLFLLAIYTFIFAIVLRARWPGAEHAGRGEFALRMFCGMLLYNMFAEVVNAAPTLITTNPNYVKKVVFPLEILVVAALVTALINMLIGYMAWWVGWGLLRGTWPQATAAWFPVVVLPVCLTTLGASWLLASIGVFVRDVGHAVALVVQALFFMTPIFYSIEQVPERFRRILEINPLAHSVEDIRGVLILGQHPTWGWWCVSMGMALVLVVFGYAFFMKSKRAFADVV